MCSLTMTSADDGGTKQFDPVVADGKPKFPVPEKASESESESNTQFSGGNEKKGKKLLEEDTECGEGIDVISRANEGYETPTSPENRIPAIRECPPAPRKLRPSRLKRKRSTSDRRCLEPEEVQSLFRAVRDDDVFETSNKRARRDDEDDDNDKDRS